MHQINEDGHFLTSSRFRYSSEYVFHFNIAECRPFCAYPTASNLWSENSNDVSVAAAPIITATYVSITQVRLTISQPVGKADYYILVSDPPMNDPQLAEIGSTLAEGKQIDASGVVNLLNLEEYRPYIFYVSSEYHENFILRY